MKKREDRSRTSPERLASPFAQLASLRASLPEASAAPSEAMPTSGAVSGSVSDSVSGSAPASRDPKPPAPKGPARAVVRMERKGRGGKEATVVEQLGLPARELEVWLTALKNALGCGGTVEEGALVLQGDQRPRLPALLTKRGVRRVTVG